MGIIVNSSNELFLPLHQFQRLTDQRAFGAMAVRLDPRDDLLAEGQALV
jgi:hypothetical protein